MLGRRGLACGITALGLLGACGGETLTNAAVGSTSTSSASSGSGGNSATGNGGDVTSISSSNGAGGSITGPIGGERPVTVIAPPAYSPNVAAPLLLLLHGYSAGGDVQELYLDLGTEAAKRGYLFAHPDGSIDKGGLEFWNATDACCDFYGSGIDDSTYLAKTIADIQLVFNVDARRIYLMGHSNGAFMSHRVACDHADLISAIATLSGSQYKDATQCKPSEPVSALIIQGTLDSVILYGGGKLFGKDYPGAMETAQDWANNDGCKGAPNESLPNLDLVGLPIAETQVLRWENCAAKSSVEHWRIGGATHIPLFKKNFNAELFDFFDGHAKP